MESRPDDTYSAQLPRWNDRLGLFHITANQFVGKSFAMKNCLSKNALSEPDRKSNEQEIEVDSRVPLLNKSMVPKFKLTFAITVALTIRNVENEFFLRLKFDTASLGSTSMNFGINKITSVNQMWRNSWTHWITLQQRHLLEKIYWQRQPNHFWNSFNWKLHLCNHLFTRLSICIVTNRRFCPTLKSVVLSHYQNRRFCTVFKIGCFVPL